MAATRRPRVRARFGAAVAVYALILGGCGRTGRADARPAPPASEAHFPLRIEDDLGRTVMVAREPRRIVTLLPSHSETVCALGVCDRLVGVDEFSDYPPEVTRLPKLGGMYDARLESMLGLSPDLVVSSEGLPALATMERVGLTVWGGSARRLEDVYRVIRAIGALVGRPAEGAKLAERVRADVEAGAERLRNLPRVRVYYELDATPFAAGPDSFIGELLSKAGGDNVVPRGIGDFPKVSAEVVANSDPEVVFGPDFDALAKRPGWDRTAAVRNHRVFALTDADRAFVVRPGPRIAEGLRVLARRMHPEIAP